eukprot:gene5925-9755_t
MSTEGGILTAASSTTQTGVNFSLVKLGPMVQVVVGATIASMALAATTLTVIVVATTSSFYPPSLKPDLYTTSKTTAITMDVLSNDADPKGGALALSKVTQPAYGSVQIDTTNKLIYTPQNMLKSGPHYRGPVYFTYSAKNEKLESTTNVTIEVTNHKPEPVSLRYVVPMNSKNNAVKVLVDANNNGKAAQDIDLDEMFISAITKQPTNGVASISADNKTIIYTPTTGFTNAPAGTDAYSTAVTADVITYEVSDGDDSVSVDVGFLVTNEPPVANFDSFTGPQNKILENLDVLANDVDPNGDDLTITSVNNNGRGYAQVSADKKTISYYPVEGVYQDTFEYTITDGVSTSSTFVTVSLVNTKPTATDVSVDVQKNSKDNAITLTYSDVDPFSPLTVSISTPPAKGAYQLTSQSKSVTEQFLTGFDKDITYVVNTYTLTYTPAAGELYSENFKFRVNDGYATVDATVTVNVVNSAPVAVADTITSQKNIKKSADIVANDSDPNGDAIKIKSVDAATTKGGSVSVSSETTIEYTPKADFTGVDTFNYVLTDVQSDVSKQLTSTAQVTIQVDNTAPVAVADSYSVQRGLTATFDVLSNDKDENGDALTIGSFDATSSSGVTLKKVGEKIEYTALTAAPYTDTFKYVANDGAADSNEVVVTISVLNSAPVAVPDSYSMTWNTKQSFSILENDQDANPGDAAALTVHSISTPPTSGTATIDSNSKSITYIPNTGFVGSDQFYYIAKDGSDNSNAALVQIDVQNAAPVAVNDAYTAHHQQTTKVYDVLSNDSDPNGDALRIKSVTTPTHGTAVIENNKIKFTATSTVGTSTFQYTCTDENKDATATVTVSVTNKAPVANNDAATTHWNNAAGVQINVLENDSDEDLDSLSVLSFTEPSKGTVTRSGNVLTYKPDGSSKGVFTFDYTISDGSATASATVSVTVTNSNTPTASDASHTIHWRTTPTLTKVTSSGSDGNGDSLAVSYKPPANGAVTKSTDGTTGAVTLSYAQTQPYKGSDSFEFTVSDGLEKVSKTISFTLTNNAPVAKSYTKEIQFSDAAAGITLNVAADSTDSDAADISMLTVTSISTNPAHGTAVITDSGKTVKYTPTANWAGDDSFQYVVSDGLDTSTGTANIKVVSPAIPEATKTYSVHWRTSQSTGTIFDVLNTPKVSNPVDSTYLYLTGVTSTTPSNGVVTYEATETRDSGNHVYKVKYVSNSGFVGSDSFKLQTSNGLVTGFIVVTVHVQNTAPVASDVSYTGHHFNTVQTYDVMANDKDADSDPISIKSVQAAPQGTAVIENNKIKYTANTFVGLVQFTYTITDGNKDATAKISITTQNSAPVANDDVATVHWTESSTGVTISVLTNDKDADGDSLTVTAVSSPSIGIATINGGSTITYKPTGSFVGTATFTYTISDGTATAQATVTVSVTNANVPSTSDKSFNIHWRTKPTSITGLYTAAKDADGDSHVLTFSSATSGTVTKSTVGGIDQLSYSQNNLYKGADSFTYTVSDGKASSTSNINFNIYNNAPSAKSYSTVLQYNVAAAGVTFNVVADGTDPDTADSSNLAIKSVGTPTSGGTATIVGNTIKFVPKENWGGQDTFTYVLTDGLDDSTGTVQVLVTSPNIGGEQKGYSVHWIGSQTTGNIFDLVVSPDIKDPVTSKYLTLTSNTLTAPTSGALTYEAAFVKDQGEKVYKVKYVSNNGFVGTDTFVVETTNDLVGGISNITVSVVVTNDAPIAVDDTFTNHKWGTVQTYDVLSNDNDPSSDPITIKSVATPAHGTAVIENNKIKFTADTFVGLVQFTYTITDGNKDATAKISITTANNAPVANDDAASIHWTESSTGVTISVLTNDKDADGDSLTVTAVSSPSIGIATINGGSTITYKPTGSFVGTATFTYTISDGTATAQATVTVSVTNANVPSTSDKSFNIHWRTKPTSITGLYTAAKDADGDSHVLTFSSATSGTVTKSTVGGIDQLSYSQNNLYKGADSFTYTVRADSFTYTVSDGKASSTSNINFNIYNNAPSAKSYTSTVEYANAATGVTFNVVADGSDPDTADSSNLAIKSVGTPANGGTATIVGNTIKFVPKSNYVGSDSVTYVLSDGLDDASATITVNVNAPALSAASKSYSVHWKASQTTGNVFDVVSGITDPVSTKTIWLSGNTLQAPDSGTLTYEAAYVRDGASAKKYKVKYVSNTGFTGTDTFKVEMTNDHGKSVITVSVSVTNSVPTVNSISTSLHWAVASKELDILASAKDGDAEDTVVYDSHVQPSCGTVTQSGGKLTFANKAPAVLGDCSFNFVVTDGLAKVTKQATVSVTNDAPVAADKTFNIHWTEHKDGYTMNLVTGATDANGDSITLQSVQSLSNSAAGTLSKISSTSAKLTAATPSTFVNNAVTFSYTLTDGASTVSKVVTVNVQNSIPVANADSVAITGTQPASATLMDVLANDTDGDQPSKDATLTINSFSYSGSGTVAKSGNKLSYTPPAQFIGTETLTYTATDGFSVSTPATVTIVVSNSAPVANADSATVHWKSNVVVSPLDNDSDPENNVPLSLDSISSQPSSGTAVKSSNTVKYTPSTSITYTGSDGAKRTAVDTFKYKVKDTYGVISEGTVSITVKNTPPVANADVFTFAKSSANPTQTIDVLANDVDADGDSLTISSISYTSGNGAAVQIVDNKISYKPEASFRGNDIVTYVISDGQLTATAQLTVTVSNQAPTCSAITKTVDKRTSYTWDILALSNANDANGDSLTVALDNSNTYDKAEVILQSSSSVQFTSKAERSGTFIFKFKVSDGLLTCNSQVTVTIINKAPVAASDNFGAFKQNSASHVIDALSNDSDADTGDSIILTSVSIPSSAGTVSVENNKIKYLPKDDFSGSTTATYQIKDSDQDGSKTATGTVSIVITEVLPKANDDTIKVDMNTVATIKISDLLTNDEAPSGMVNRFHSLVDCSTLDSNTYCVNGKQPILNSPSAGYITVSYTQNSCRENKFKYCIDTDKLPGVTGGQACATVTVKYQNCVCSGKVDVTFVLDSSGSMALSDWKKQVDFSLNITKAITADLTNSDDMKIGLVQFGSYADVIVNMESYSNTVANKFEKLKNNHQYGWTGTLDGLNSAINLQDTTSTRKEIPKVIVVMSDGVANRPCDCKEKCHYTGNNPCEYCVKCEWQYNIMCQPCASPVPRATTINGYKKATGSKADWKVVAMGLGDELYNYNSLGWNLIKGMNYDASETLLVKFENLNKATQQIVDEICAVSY